MRLKVRFRNPRAFISEYTQNISKGGLFIKTQKPCGLEEMVEVVLLLPGSGQEVSCLGEVAHVITAAEADDENPAGMGLRLKELTEKDRQTIEQFIDQEIRTSGDQGLEGRRQHTRYEARIRVRFGSQEALLEEWVHNISHGGIFIQTDKPKPLHDRMLIVLTHPDSREEMIVHGEVVRLVAPAEAEATGQKVGMGVRFQEMDEYTRNQLENFINSKHVSLPKRADLEES
jgi:type IV pilus assembly protein PilZ